MIRLTSGGEMTITGTQKTNVEIGKRQQIEIAIEVIKQEFGIANSRGYYHYVEGGNLMLCEEHSAGSHSHEVRSIVRPISPAESAALLLIELLEKRQFESYKSTHP